MVITAIANNENGASVRSKLNSVITEVNAGLETLTSDLILYVRTDGDNANPGTANTAGGAFATWQGANNAYAARYLHAGFKVTIQAGQASTTFSIGESFVVKRAIGSGNLTLDFNGGTLQSSGTLTDNGPRQRSLIEITGVQDVTLKNVTLVHQNVDGNAGWNQTLRCSKYGDLVCDNVIFGALGNVNTFGGHILSESKGNIFFTNGYAISGGAGPSNNAMAHYKFRSGGFIDLNDAITVTITGTPKFSIFADGRSTAVWAAYRASGSFFSGSVASGCKQFQLAGNAVIETYGVGVESGFFPGSNPGTKATGGEFT